MVTCWLPFPCCSPGLFQTAWPPVLPICLRAAGTICSLQLCRRVHALFGALHRLKRSGTSAGLRELAAEGLGELVEVTGEDALKPFVVQVTHH